MKKRRFPCVSARSAKLPGRSLEPFSNGRPRGMTVTAATPYRIRLTGLASLAALRFERIWGPSSLAWICGSCFSDTPDHPITRSWTPLPVYPISSQVIPTGPRPRAVFAWMGRVWRGFERFTHDWRRVPFAPPTPTPYVDPIRPKVTQFDPMLRRSAEGRNLCKPRGANSPRLKRSS